MEKILLKNSEINWGKNLRKCTIFDVGYATVFSVFTLFLHLSAHFSIVYSGVRYIVAQPSR